MRRLLRFLSILLLLLTCATPVLRAASFDEANAAFAAGKYDQAAATLQELIAREGPSAARLYHLGNAQYKLKQHGPAILAYERARLLAPRDNDIQQNLQLAREAAVTPDSTPPPPWWSQPLYWLSLHEWSRVTTTGAVLISLGVLAWGLIGQRTPKLKQATLTALVLGVIAAPMGGFALWQRAGERTLGIITAEQPTLRISPFATATPTDSPGTGRHVILGETYAGWIHLTLPGSQLAGWLPEGDVAALMPPP